MVCSFFSNNRTWWILSNHHGKLLFNHEFLSEIHLSHMSWQMNLKIYNLFAYTHVNHEIASIYILFYYKITDVLVKTKMYITKHTCTKDVHSFRQREYAKVVEWISKAWYQARFNVVWQNFAKYCGLRHILRTINLDISCVRLS